MSGGSSPEELEAQIEAQREQLGETVDALTAKLDVKTHAKDGLASAKDAVTTDSGGPRPQVLGAAAALVLAVAAVVWWRRSAG